MRPGFPKPFLTVMWGKPCIGFQSPCPFEEKGRGGEEGCDEVCRTHRTGGLKKVQVRVRPLLLSRLTARAWGGAVLSPGGPKVAIGKPGFWPGIVKQTRGQRALECQQLLSWRMKISYPGSQLTLPGLDLRSSQETRQSTIDFHE